jgi:leucyl aminopeptidase
MNEIFWAGEPVKDKTTVIIATKDSKLDTYGITIQEKVYADQMIINKQHTVVLNRYSHLMIIQFAEEKKNEATVNECFRNAAYDINNILSEHKITDIQIIDAVENAKQTLAFTEGLLLSNYQFLKYFSEKKEKKFSLGSVTVISKLIDQKQLDELNYLIRAVYYARDMVNEPASFLTSVQLSKEIQKMGQEAGFDVETLNKSQIEMLKMGGLLAVNKGSSEPPTFTIMEWKPSNAINKNPIVLVGKGVVYDSGGLSLKPTHDSMDYMKCDMAGAAAVTGTLYTLAKTKVPLYVIGLVPSTDNRIDALSYAPGDIITMYNGTTVEVLNADAEGRLILADALSYAKQFDPQLVITIATLTGAAHRAIGEVGVVGMGNASSEIFSKLKDSGWNVYERIAEFPFWEEYAEMIKSDVADLKNIGGELAGAITAGKFLEYFTNYPFIHLDIAGMAFIKDGDTYKGNGATGFGVRLLFDFLKKQISNQ